MNENEFPRHKASLSLSHNEHKAVYQSIAAYTEKYPDGFPWVSEEQRLKAIAADSMWELQWYPDTPIGFNKLAACDLDLLLFAARAIEVGEHEP